jgi:hypothetical protein
MDFVDAMSRILGGHDLEFFCENWSVSFDESHVEGTAACERKMFLEGEFYRWSAWKKKASVRLVSHRISEYKNDENGKGICGYVTWSKGLTRSGDEIEGFDNGSVEVSALVTPELFDGLLVLLRNDGVDLRADFTLSAAPPEDWDGSAPLQINSVGIFAQRAPRNRNQ